MKRPTYKSIREAARKSDRAALDSSIQKYLYLLQLSISRVRNLSERFLADNGCAMCQRHPTDPRSCPLKKRCKGDCIPEWKYMNSAKNRLSAFPCLQPTDEYNEFMYNASKILTKLLKCRGEIK